MFQPLIGANVPLMQSADSSWPGLDHEGAEGTEDAGGAEGYCANYGTGGGDMGKMIRSGRLESALGWRCTMADASGYDF